MGLTGDARLAMQAVYASAWLPELQRPLDVVIVDTMYLLYKYTPDITHGGKDLLRFFHEQSNRAFSQGVETYVFLFDHKQSVPEGKKLEQMKRRVNVDLPYNEVTDMNSLPIPWLESLQHSRTRENMIAWIVDALISHHTLIPPNKSLIIHHKDATRVTCEGSHVLNEEDLGTNATGIGEADVAQAFWLARFRHKHVAIRTHDTDSIAILLLCTQLKPPTSNGSVRLWLASPQKKRTFESQQQTCVRVRMKDPDNESDSDEERASESPILLGNENFSVIDIMKLATNIRRGGRGVVELKSGKRKNGDANTKELTLYPTPIPDFVALLIAQGTDYARKLTYFVNVYDALHYGTKYLAQSNRRVVTIKASASANDTRTINFSMDEYKNALKASVVASNKKQARLVDNFQSQMVFASWNTMYWSWHSAGLGKRPEELKCENWGWINGGTAISHNVQPQMCIRLNS